MIRCGKEWPGFWLYINQSDMKRKRKLEIAGLACMMPWMAFAQQIGPLAAPVRLFEDGKELFLRHDYAAAQQTLTHYLQQDTSAEFAEEAAYMLACTSYELNKPGRIRRLKAFVEQYPDSRYVNRVNALIGSAYFFDKNYPEAIMYFEKCNVRWLADGERDEVLLRLGTSYLKGGALKDATLWFSILKDVSREYRLDAVYHLAYIDYARERYDEALEGFRLAGESGKYAPYTPYYIADICLEKHDYQKAKRLADMYLEAYPRHEYALLMQRIGGEASYGMGRYAEAVKPLETYCGSPEGGKDREAQYALGMSYYQTGVYSKAVDALNKATGRPDALAQNAYLHSGMAYLRLKDRTRARMAFEQASAMTFDRNVQEQALYNYALCIHETSYSPFAESVTVFERFLNEFPNSAYAAKVNDYLVEVYMNTRSYQAALNSIAKISHPGDRILEAKQKLLFRIGILAFAQAAFENAIGYFTQSIDLGRYDRQTKADAYYWRGESKYRLEQYAQAASDYRLYLEYTPGRTGEEYALALYNLGYVAFKQKQYEQALTWFTRCSQAQVKDRRIVADVYNRMGDCHFHARRFAEASALYAQASAADPSLGDYSLFQEAFVKGLQRDYAGKIQTLNRLLTDYPASPYIDDALYEQGRAFVQQENNAGAIERYTVLLRRFPESPLSRKASNEIGLLYYQEDKYPEAIAAYKKVISDYPGSEEARLAQRDLKSIYIDLNRVDDYLSFVSTLPGGANFDVNERDSLTYVAAERVYMRGETEEAKASFTRYLQSFPQGAFSVNASYYLGLMAYNEKNYTEASAYLDKVLAYPDNKFSGEAMKLCAGIAYQEREYGKALSLYARIADRAASQEERVDALRRALECARLSENPEEILALASSLLSQSKLAPEVENEARYARAKACIGEGKTQEAVGDLTLLAKDTRNEYGAEAKYLLAQFYFDTGETEKAEKEVLDYIDASTPHAYWLARSFVLLSDIYMKMGRDVDAKQYLLSLKQNYQADDDIQEMIETRLERLENE